MSLHIENILIFFLIHLYLFLLLPNRFHKFSGLKQHSCIITQSPRTGSPSIAELNLLLRVSQSKVRCQVGCTTLGLLLTSCGWWRKSVPCSCGTQVSVFLLCMAWGLLSAPPGHSQFLSQHDNSLLQNQQGRILTSPLTLLCSDMAYICMSGLESSES